LVVFTEKKSLGFGKLSDASNLLAHIATTKPEQESLSSNFSALRDLCSAGPNKSSKLAK
jgi:hypothetical protein